MHFPKPLEDTVFVSFSMKKIIFAAILVFSRHFGFIFWHIIFPIKYEYFQRISRLQIENIFHGWFLVIFQKIKVKNPPSWISPPLLKISQKILPQYVRLIAYYKTWNNFFENPNIEILEVKKYVFLPTLISQPP
jgi:hypothetical protein